MNKYGRRSMFEFIYYFCALHNMEVSGQLYALATLHPQKSLVSHWAR